MGDAVRYQTEGRVAVLTLNLPEKRNPLSLVLVQDLIAALERAQGEDGVGAVLLTGAGEAFCAGGDLREFQQMMERPSLQVYDEGRSTAELFKLLDAYDKPVIAAVNGPALGGGFGLVCASHMAIASERARFGCTEIRLGLFPMVVFPAVRRAVGDRKALELSLTGEILDAQEALRLGVVRQVVAHEKLMEEAMALASKVAAFSPVALRMGLEAFRMSTGVPYGQAVDYLNTLRTIVFHTEDLREGASAFLERRPPQWRGR